jgi:hypothetical protein
MTRNDLLEEVHSLPRGHFLRSFVEAIENRIIPVENFLEPHRQSSRLLLHQRVADVLALNGGRTFNVADLAAAKTGAVAARYPWAAALLGQCSARVDVAKHALIITCPLNAADGGNSSGSLPPAVGAH